mmetsp:Transcript_7277/g.12862  ORF Transcript_7277/g.12862 Transcript_7277/m.12862 type:complete len:241 (+) Transcript_7277:220-942(+)
MCAYFSGRPICLFVGARSTFGGVGVAAWVACMCVSMGPIQPPSKRSLLLHHPHWYSSLASPRLCHGPQHEQLVGPQLESCNSQRLPTALQGPGPLLPAFSPAEFGPSNSIRCDPWPTAIPGCIHNLTMGAAFLVRSSQRIKEQYTERILNTSQVHRVPSLSRCPPPSLSLLHHHSWLRRLLQVMEYAKGLSGVHSEGSTSSANFRISSWSSFDNTPAQQPNVQLMSGRLVQCHRPVHPRC